MSNSNSIKSHQLKCACSLIDLSTTINKVSQNIVLFRSVHEAIRKFVLFLFSIRTQYIW